MVKKWYIKQIKDQFALIKWHLNVAIVTLKIVDPINFVEEQIAEAHHSPLHKEELYKSQNTVFKACHVKVGYRGA